VPDPHANAAFLAEHAAEIAAAAERIAPHVRRTPLLATDVDRRLRLKPECFQRTGSFKARGAFNAVLRLREQAPDTAGVIAVSSGNHAQALPLAAVLTGRVPADGGRPVGVVLSGGNAAPGLVARLLGTA
jgi:threonine dehydratase